jgi:hypothetical protein
VVAIVNVVGSLALIYDIFLKKAERLKSAISGFDRLLLRDTDRQAHIDAAAFMVGYLLGLPCFCFQPDLTEAMKMLKDNPSSLQVYQQPASKELLSLSKNDSLSSDTELQTTGSNMLDKMAQMNNKKSIRIDSLMSLGRVLVWLMAPVAAESLKYGTTFFSDPRRSERLLQVLFDSKLLAESYQMQNDKEWRKLIVDWAYSEAVLLVKRYGDLLDELQGYLLTNTASVGECVFLIEEELQS